MTNPINPNYVPNNGTRLVTDRYDFQHHIDGVNFRHKASQIDLDTTININGNLVNTVEAALVVLAPLVPTPLPDATTSSKGVIQITGDISGSATNISVIGLRGYPLNTLAPSVNNVLTWTGSTWSPQPTQNTFTPGGDLTGSSVAQYIQYITGNAGVITFGPNASAINFAVSATPAIGQAPTGGATGQNITITAQNAGSGGTAGSVVLYGGTATGGVQGNVILKSNDNHNMLQVQDINARKILSLVSPNGTGPNATNLPDNSGSHIIFINDTSTPPTSGTPTGGAILYSQSGTLYVKQSDSSTFAIGSSPNPYMWGNSANHQVYNQQVYKISYGVTSEIALTYPLVDQLSYLVEICSIGKGAGSTKSRRTKLASGYTRSGGAPVIIGTLSTIYDESSDIYAASWVAPTIGVSGNNLIISTGNSGVDTSPNIDWFITIRIMNVF